jgi:hypothetical protein
MTLLRLGLWAAAYFLVFTPVALALRIARPDPLRLARQSGQGSYWRTADPRGHMTMRSGR